jgi:hypothetical protein
MDAQTDPTPLEEQLRHANDKIIELRSELTDAQNLNDQMLEYLEDRKNQTENWIDVCNMQMDDSGVWRFDPNQTELWNKYDELLDDYSKLVRQWNKSCGRFNAVVAPQDIGRPLAASAAQQAEILKRHKQGMSLRAIAGAMSQSLRTVRTVVEKHNGTDRTSKRKKELRRLEFDRQRAIAFRAKMARRKQLEKDITALDKQCDRLIKAAKGLGR